MNKAYARARHDERQAFAAYQQASAALTEAINGLAYYADGSERRAYDIAVDDASAAHRQASDAWTMAAEKARIAVHAPMDELRVRDGWTLVPSFRSYWYDDMKDAMEASHEAWLEMLDLIEAGKISPAASVTLVCREGYSIHGTRHGWSVTKH